MYVLMYLFIGLLTADKMMHCTVGVIEPYFYVFFFLDRDGGLSPAGPIMPAGDAWTPTVNDRCATVNASQVLNLKSRVKLPF